MLKYEILYYNDNKLTFLDISQKITIKTILFYLYGLIKILINVDDELFWKEK